MTDILTNAEIDALGRARTKNGPAVFAWQAKLIAHARAANDRMEKDLDIIKRQTAEIERLVKIDSEWKLWAELERAADRTRDLEAMLREIVEDSCPYDDSDDVVLAQPVSNEKLNRAEALLAASPEAAGRLPGAVLQANSDGTISKVEAP